jgi:hypothetical protein
VTGPMLFTSALSLSLLPSTFLLLFLHLFQVPVQAGEFLFPEAAKRVYPVGNVLERDSHECAWTPLCIARAHDQARAFEDAEVLRDCRLTQVEGLHELRDICVAGSKASKNRSARGICERCKDRAQTINSFIHRHTAILPYGDVQVNRFLRFTGDQNLLTSSFTALVVVAQLAPISDELISQLVSAGFERYLKRSLHRREHLQKMKEALHG